MNTTTDTLKPTPADFRTPAIVEACLDFIAHKANAQTVRAVVDEIGEALLVEHPLKCPRTGEALTVSNAWRAVDDEAWSRWYNACREEQTKRGIGKDLPPELCPALVAESAMRDAKHRLVDISGAKFGVTADKIWRRDFRKVDEWVDLVCHLALSKGGAR